MAIFLQVLQIVAPVFFLATAGWLWVRRGWEYDIVFVTRLAMQLSLPCLIFVALMQTEIDPTVLRDTAIASAVAYPAVALILWAVLKLLGTDLRTYLAPLIFGNTGNLGLPLALFAFGSLGLDYAVVVFAVMIVFSFTFGVWLVSGSGSPTTVLKEPIVWATILGAVFLVQGWGLPVWALNTLELAGQVGIPVMLITLGVAVARLTPGSLVKAIGVSVLKLVICVAVGWGTGLAFGLTGTAFGVLVLQTATPVAVTSYMLAEKFGADSDAVAGLVVVSTLISVAALPLLLAALL